MIKKFMYLVVILVLSASAMSYADTNIKVKVNDELVAFPDAVPFIDENNRTLIPVRFVSEKLGAKVGWNGETQTVTVDLDDKNVQLTIDQKKISVNGQNQTMDTQAIIKDSRTFVPVRFVAEALGKTVGWNGSTKTVLITTGQNTAEGEGKKISVTDGMGGQLQVTQYFVTLPYGDLVKVKLNEYNPEYMQLWTKSETKYLLYIDGEWREHPVLNVTTNSEYQMIDGYYVWHYLTESSSYDIENASELGFKDGKDIYYIDNPFAE